MAGKHISLLVHFTWSTAGREPWINPEWHERLNAYVGGVMNNKSTKLLAAGGMYDHIHLYASMPSTLSLADLVNTVKSNFVAMDSRIISKCARFRLARRIWSLQC
jgi:putative transposase